MAVWRDIPTKFSWDGESMVPTAVPKKSVPVRPSKVSVPVVVEDGFDGFSEEEKIAALRTEEALEAVLSFVPESPGDVVSDSPSPVGLEEDPQKTSGSRTDLWEEPVQDLSVGNSAIYPDGRMISNPNHLMLFIGRGAEIFRKYRQDGWVSSLHRSDGKSNPVSESLVDTLIKSGVLKESRPGVFRGGY